MRYNLNKLSLCFYSINIIHIQIVALTHHPILMNNNCLHTLYFLFIYFYFYKKNYSFLSIFYLSLCSYGALIHHPCPFRTCDGHSYTLYMMKQKFFFSKKKGFWYFAWHEVSFHCITFVHILYTKKRKYS